MRTPLLCNFGILAATIPLFVLLGCYTQFATVGDERGLQYSSDTEGYPDSTTQDEYEDARQSFYYDSYYPAMGVGLAYGWGYPWYGYGYRGYFDPFYQFGVYNHVGGFGWYQPSRYYGGYHSVGGGRRGPARTIGSTRTMGVTRGPVGPVRGPAGSLNLPVGARSRNTSPAIGGRNRVSVTTPGVSTGRRGTGGTRGGVRSGSRIVSRPYDQYPRPAPAPAQGSGRSDGGNRGTAQPAYTPAPSPPPSAPPPSSGNRGGEAHGGSSRGGGSERGGSRR